MNTALKALVAVACLVVIGCGTWWMMDRNAAKAEAERTAQIVRDARNHTQLERCRSDVAAWDRGDRSAFQKRFGSNAEEGVDLCRNLIKLEKIRTSTLSELHE